MWPETPCKICGTMTIDEGGLCSSDCVTKWEALPANGGDPGDEHIESKLQEPTFPHGVINYVTLLDRLVPEFLSMAAAYHSFEDADNCPTCLLRRQAKEYLDGRKKFSDSTITA